MSTRAVRLHLALHHHQPFGNLPGVLEECCRRGYLPLLHVLEEAAPLKFNLSYSGPLLEFLAVRFPEYITTLRRMVEAGRVEILSTGFYEPILADLEEDDRLAQLELTRAWWNPLGIRPRGLWLAEGVWESDLPRTMFRAGLDYTIVPRERLLQGGVPASRIQGHLLTEFQGACCRLFPHEEALQRMVPFGGVDELFAYLRRNANRGEVSLTCADQAERWSIWPGSRERLLESGHLAQMLARFRESADWVHTALFSETLDGMPSSGRCYLPPGVSKELGVWSLPDETRTSFQQARNNLSTRFDADQFLPYFRVGSWAGFRSRYLESNLMHKKGLWIKRRLAPDHPHGAEISRCLHQAQCNTAYWYGTSGGIYAPHLRESVWRSLLEAEALRLAGQPARVFCEDADADGSEEILLQSAQTGLMWSPERGGALVEWSDLALGVNFCNTMSCYRESSPAQGDKPAFAGEPIPGGNVDPWVRHAFQDLFFKKHTTVEELATGRYQELGDFIKRPFSAEWHTHPDGTLEVLLEATGQVQMTGPVSMKLGKKFLWNPLRPRSLNVEYTLENQGKLPVQSILGLMVNLALPGGEDQVHFGAGDRKHAPETSWFEGEATRWSAESGSGMPGVRFHSERAISLWSYPVQSMAGEGVSAIRQGNALVSGLSIQLAPGETLHWPFTVDWSGTSTV